jgi:hypothetical protein
MDGQFGWGREEGGWRKGPWTAQEDKLLVEYVRQHGEGRWNSVAKLTGILINTVSDSRLFCRSLNCLSSSSIPEASCELRLLIQRN